MASKVFVGNLSFQTTREDLESLFAQVGQIKDVFLPIDRATDRPRGFAFVEYNSDEEATQAIARFNGYELGGRPLRVNEAEARPKGERSFAPRPSFDGPRGGGGGGRGPGGGGGGGGNNPYGPPGGKSKGSRRNVRAKKRQL